jgi:hypothetical protein
MALWSIDVTIKSQQPESRHHSHHPLQHLHQVYICVAFENYLCVAFETYITLHRTTKQKNEFAFELTIDLHITNYFSEESCISEHSSKSPLFSRLAPTVESLGSRRRERVDY